MYSEHSTSRTILRQKSRNLKPTRSCWWRRSCKKKKWFLERKVLEFIECPWRRACSWSTVKTRAWVGRYAIYYTSVFLIVFLNDFYYNCIGIYSFIFTEPITNEVEPVNDAHKVNKRRKFRRKKYYSYTTNNKRCFACKFALGQNIIIFIFDKKFMVVRDKLFGH